MGTHGHGLLGRAVMGSVAQRVLTESDAPVLLVK
jgi:nucleotide-binding universal stress UspA family protein